MAAQGAKTAIFNWTSPGSARRRALAPDLAQAGAAAKPEGRSSAPTRGSGLSRRLDLRQAWGRRGGDRRRPRRGRAGREALDRLGHLVGGGVVEQVADTLERDISGALNLARQPFRLMACAHQPVLAAGDDEGRD